jgi:hypothetical protein
LIDEALAESGEGLIVFSGNVSDKEQDGSDVDAPTFGAPYSLPSAAVIGQWGKPCEF